MGFRTISTSAFILAAVVISAGAEARDKATIDTIVIDGTLGPVLKGNDIGGLNGKSATVTIQASESLKPYKTTATSASYHIPKGDIVVTFNGKNYNSTSRSTMIIKLGSTADLLTVKGTITYDGVTVKVSDTSSLASGSWSSSVLQHPALFSPSPQNLTEPSSTFTYTAIGETTVLGVTGTISNSD